MRSEVGEWLATCVGGPICILLLSWSLLIYQSQPGRSKRRVDVLAVAVLAQSLLHQLGLLLYAILTLLQPANHFSELCSSLVWVINSSSILQELSLTSIAVFAALTARDEGPNIKKHHLKYHLLSLTVISACIGVTGVLNFEPDGCVFLANDISPKYGLYFNGLRTVLAFATLLSLVAALLGGTCRASPKAELLKSVSDLSEASSKNSGSFECQQHSQHWEPSSGSCTSGSTNSRACLNKRARHTPPPDESTGWPTIYTMLFVCYAFDHLPLLVVSIRPDVLRNVCTPLNLATWLPLVKDTLLPIFLAIFDKMFCQYVAKVYTKQDNATRLTHGGVDGKFRHFEQDGEYKLQLNLNHGLKFPLSDGPAGTGLYGRLHNHTNRGRSGGTMLMGIHQYGRSNLSLSDNAYASIASESYSSSNLDSHRQQQQQQQQQQQMDSKSPKPRCHQASRNVSRANSTSNGQCKANYVAEQQQQQQQQELWRPKPAEFAQKLENLMQLEDQAYGWGARRLKHFAKSLDEIREEAPRRNARSVLGHYPETAPYALRPQLHHPHLQQQQPRLNPAALRRNQSFDLHPRSYPRIELPLVTSTTYDVKKELAIKRSLHLLEQSRRNNPEYEEEEEAGYETSDDESCDRESQDFDTMSSCRSRARSCCSVTTVANDDFEFFQRKGNKEVQSPSGRGLESKGSMRCFTPRIIEVDTPVNPKPVIQSYQLKKKITPGYSLNDLDKFGGSKVAACVSKPPTLSIESLKSILRSSDVSYLDNGEICRHHHDLGGSAPDFKKIFVTEFI